MTRAAYFTVPWCTGAEHEQPLGNHMQPGWDTDANGGCTAAGFLDAPGYVASGGVMGHHYGDHLVLLHGADRGAS